MTQKLDALQAALESALAGKIQSLVRERGEITVRVAAADYLDACLALRDHDGLGFEQMMDLCGVDMSAYKDGAFDGPRFVVVLHLLSIRLNHRLRLKVACPDDELPAVPSVTSIWNAANWFEREAFDLYGILFDGHVDLRRLLTDYGFIGHPFRKDFPVIGNVEMRYDPERKRVIYQPVTIEPREITPRVVREENYGGLH